MFCGKRRGEQSLKGFNGVSACCKSAERKVSGKGKIKERGNTKEDKIVHHGGEGCLRVCAAKRKFTQSSARSLWTYAPVPHGAMRPQSMDLCIHGLQGCMSIPYGLTRPDARELCAHVLRRYGERFLQVSRLYGFKQLPPPECFVRTSMQQVLNVKSSAMIAITRAELFSAVPANSRFQRGSIRTSREWERRCVFQIS